MHASEKLSLEQIRQLVAASEGLRFESENRRQMYAWVESVLIEHQFKQQGRVARGLLRRYIEKMTGLSPGPGHGAECQADGSVPRGTILAAPGQPEASSALVGSRLFSGS